MERIFKGDDAVLFRVALGKVVATRCLHGTFGCFRTGVGKEHNICKGVVCQQLCELFTLWNGVEVGDVPQLFSLRLERLNELRMRMTQAGDGDTRGTIHVSSTISRIKPDTFPTLKRQV